MEKIKGKEGKLIKLLFLSRELVRKLPMAE